jgi:hypothetical protein
VTWLVFVKARDILSAHTQGTYDVSLLGLDPALMNDPVGALTADPIGAVGKFTHAFGIVAPDLLRQAIWLAPALVLVWVVVSSFGRTVMLRRADEGLVARPFTLMALQAVRLAALAGSFWVWFQCVGWASRIAVTGPIAAGHEPQLVLYCSVTIVTSIGLFTLWAIVSWVFSVAPLLAMLRGAGLKKTGIAESLLAAVRLGPLKSKLVEINLVLGIVKIVLMVLAMVFSACPLPFESVTTPGFLAWWWAGVTLLYVLGSDFFHVVRLVGYLELWRAFEIAEAPLRAE